MSIVVRLVFTASNLLLVPETPFIFVFTESSLSLFVSNFALTVLKLFILFVFNVSSF